MVLVHVLIRYTRLGKAMRATAANRDLARNCGIRTDRVVTLTWLVTGALCGLAGAVFAMNSGTFGATSTDIFLVLILAAVFLGGPGEPYGAMLGALVIGLATEVSAVLHRLRLQGRGRVRDPARRCSRCARHGLLGARA